MSWKNGLKCFSQDVFHTHILVFRNVIVHTKPPKMFIITKNQEDMNYKHYSQNAQCSAASTISLLKLKHLLIWLLIRFPFVLRQMVWMTNVLTLSSWCWTLSSFWIYAVWLRTLTLIGLLHLERCKCAPVWLMRLFPDVPDLILILWCPLNSM